jgi:hypothetical protein
MVVILHNKDLAKLGHKQDMKVKKFKHSFILFPNFGHLT